MELRDQALRALAEPDPRAKAAQATALFQCARPLPLAPMAPVPAMALPGRPAAPRLVHPAKVPRRSPASPQGLAALLHAIAHIEFNAIKMARCSISSRIMENGAGRNDIDPATPLTCFWIPIRKASVARPRTAFDRRVRRERAP